MAEHHILSPSGASRWMACTPSARLEEILSDTTSEAAEEGTLAHAIGELLINNHLGRIIKKDFDVRLKFFQSHKLFGGKEMMDYCEEYAAYVMERYNEALTRNADATIYLETKLDLNKYIPGGYGTADVLIISDDILDFIDLKYGKGVQVFADNNKQLMIYSLGAYEKFSLLFDFKISRKTIYQPRLDHIDTFEMPVKELLAWGEEELKPKAKLAWNGEGYYTPGDHCLFCRAKSQCKANAEFHMQLAKYEFKLADLLSDDELVSIFKQYETFKNWIEGVSKFMLSEAVKGKQWPGLKIVEGKANRKWTDEEIVRSYLLSKGYAEDDIMKPRKLKGLTDIQKEMGKAAFNRDLNNETYLIKPKGAPSLTTEDDPRPVFTPDAIIDFENLEIDE